jgi:paraquat-inducible protein A
VRRGLGFAPAIREGLTACPDCGLLLRDPPLAPGQRLLCPRCRARLRRRGAFGAEAALPLVLAALFLLPFAFFSPLIDLRLYGQTAQASLVSGPERLEQYGFTPLGWAVLLTASLLPSLRLTALGFSLFGLGRHHPPFHVMRPLLRLAQRLRPWGMVEVYLLGFFVAYSKLIDLARVHVDRAAYILGAVMLCLVLIDDVIDYPALWRRFPLTLGRGKPGERQVLLACTLCGTVSEGEEGMACPRCGARLYRRKPQSLSLTAIFGLSAAFLYIPANLLPIMTVDYYGVGVPRTILAGVRELIAAGMWPLALLVFFASILVPVLKLVGLFLLLFSVRSRSARRLLDRTRLYRLIEEVGRWSMIDVFMLSSLVGLVQIGLLASVIPGAGALAFAAVVILTMLASASFDPRLMWDAARLGRKRG